MANEQTVLAVIRAARPNFRNAHDKVAFAIHASFLSSGYVTHAVGPNALPADALPSVSTSDEVGSDNWNQMEDEYAFIYSNPNQGSKKVLVRCLSMNDQLLVSAVSADGSEPVHLEIRVEDYDNADGGNNYGSQYKDLQKLLTAVDKEILTKLGSSSAHSAGQPSSTTEPSFSSGRRDVEVTEPPHAEPYPTGYVVPLINPIGGSDLYPEPGAGMYPTRGIGGGMLVGPDHPMFGGGGIGRRPDFPGGIPGVPPGARFDPYGPPGVPGFEPNRFIRDPRRPGGGTHPDLEHFRDGSDYI